MSAPATDPAEAVVYDVVVTGRDGIDHEEPFDTLTDAMRHVTAVLEEAQCDAVWAAEQIGRRSWLLTNSADPADVVDVGIVQRVVSVAEWEAGR